MINSSIKSLWLISLPLLWLSDASYSAIPQLQLDTRMELNSRIAYHLESPRDLASHRHLLELDQKLKYGNWQAIAGVRAFAEVAYASNSRYDSTVAKGESSEVAPNDIYLQYKSPSVIARVGNQQVVWGEAFGFYFADVVNPKDTRDFGLGDMNKQRIAIPMVNVKYMFSNAALQLLYIPKPYFDRVPGVGTDFGNQYQSVFPQGKVSLTDTRTLPLALSNGEFGLRGSTTVEGIDLGIFYFNYHSRSPNYHLSIINSSPLEGNLNAFHPSLQTIGVTATAEQEPFLLRFEALATFDKQVDAAIGGSYVNKRTNEYVAVLGADYTKITNWRLGAQLSDNYLSEAIAGGLIPRHRPLLTLHASGPIFREQNIEAIFSYVLNDGSSLGQLRYLVPLSSRIELLFGADVLLGGQRSQFGQFETASRGYVLLKGYLMGT